MTRKTKRRRPNKKSVDKKYQKINQLSKRIPAKIDKFVSTQKNLFDKILEVESIFKVLFRKSNPKVIEAMHLFKENERIKDDCMQMLRPSFQALSGMMKIVKSMPMFRDENGLGDTFNALITTLTTFESKVDTNLNITIKMSERLSNIIENMYLFNRFCVFDIAEATRHVSKTQVEIEQLLLLMEQRKLAMDEISEMDFGRMINGLIKEELTKIYYKGNFEALLIKSRL